MGIVDLKLTDKDFNALLEWIDYFVNNICATTESDVESLRAQLDLLGLKRSLARYVLDEKKRNSYLQSISELIDIILDLQDELRIDKDLVKKGLKTKSIFK